MPDTMRENVIDIIDDARAFGESLERGMSLNTAKWADRILALTEADARERERKACRLGWVHGKAGQPEITDIINERYKP